MTDMRSDKVRKGYERAPNRSLLRSLGVTEREMELPFIGIANAYNTIVPGHTHLRQPLRQGYVKALPRQGAFRLNSGLLVSVTGLPWDMRE